MAEGYSNSSTNILEAAFGFDLCPQNQQGLLRRTCLMACAFARALFFCDDMFVHGCFAALFVSCGGLFVFIDPKRIAPCMMITTSYQFISFGRHAAHRMPFLYLFVSFVVGILFLMGVWTLSCVVSCSLLFGFVRHGHSTSLPLL